MAKRAMTQAEFEEADRKKKKIKGTLGGPVEGKEGRPEIISGSHQDPNDPNVLRGDKEGAYKGPEKPKKKSVLRRLARYMYRTMGSLPAEQGTITNLRG